MTIDQISVFVENKPGRLAEITEILGAADIDLRAMSIADTADFGILRIIVSEPDRALEALKSANCVVSVTQVLAVAIEDAPGSLAKILRILADADVSVEYLYAFITHTEGHAYVILRVEDTGRATEVFAEHGVKTADSHEIYDL
ncbi:MAG: ACT domain-containing protein [Clostridiales Family XIII bacterium]|jgi:hypothetical protein|nr:ACT domain-containing protein [Clostridiales Family XIII bacterium]